MPEFLRTSKPVGDSNRNNFILIQLIIPALVGGKKQSDQALNFLNFFSLLESISDRPIFHLLGRLFQIWLLLKLLPKRIDHFRIWVSTL